MSENKNTMTTEDVLEEREKTHGDYAEHARCTQGILDAVMTERNWNRLSAEQRESVHMIAHKLGRIAVGDPDVNDHWDDIAGYAVLVSKHLPGPASSDKRTLSKPMSHRSDYNSSNQGGPRGFDPELDTVAGDTNQ